MWPFDKALEREYLRVGRHAVERWAGPRGKLERRACLTLEPSASNLGAALTEMYASPVPRKVTLVVESAFMPLTLLETGATPWRTDELAALARHRLGVPQPPGAGGGDALVRTDYRPGQQQSLVYLLDAQLRQALMDAGKTAGLRWAGLLPAFSWSLEYHDPARQWPRRTGWWAWPEQDRLLVARIAHGRTVYLNAGATLVEQAALIEQQVLWECARAGIDRAGQSPVEPISAGSWGGAL